MTGCLHCCLCLYWSLCSCCLLVPAAKICTQPRQVVRTQTSYAAHNSGFQALPDYLDSRKRSASPLQHTCAKEQLQIVPRRATLRSSSRLCHVIALACIFLLYCSSLCGSFHLLMLALHGLKCQVANRVSGYTQYGMAVVHCRVHVGTSMQ